MGHTRLPRTSRDDGQTAVEYAGLIVVAAAMVLGLLSVIPSFRSSVSDAICRLFGGDCGHSSEAAPVRPAGERPGGQASQPTGPGMYFARRAPSGDDDDLGLVPLGDLEETDLFDLDGCRGPFGGDMCMSGDVTFSEHVSGILVFLYELCDEDMACVRREAGTILDSLREQFPKLEVDQLMRAFEEEELPEKIEDVRDEGGCLNLRVETTWLGLGDERLRWRHRRSGSGNDCFGGAALRLADAKEPAERKFEVTAGRDGVKVTLKVGTTDLLRTGYDATGGNVRALLDLIESQGGQTVPTDGLAGQLWDEAVKAEHHGGLAEAIEASRNGDICLTVQVSPQEGGDVEAEWSTTPRGRGRC